MAGQNVVTPDVEDPGDVIQRVIMAERDAVVTAEVGPEHDLTPRPVRIDEHFRQQVIAIADQLGVVTHPASIAAAIRELKLRAAAGERAGARRLERVLTRIRGALDADLEPVEIEEIMPDITKLLARALGAG
jgi:hypothetical protein